MDTPDPARPVADHRLGLPKLVGEADAVGIFDEIGFGDWLRYLTGLIEVAGGVGLPVPRLSGPTAAGRSVTMTSAGATQAFIHRGRTRAGAVPAGAGRGVRLDRLPAARQHRRAVRGTLSR
ncbi:DoxX family protein [Nocardia sputi]|uniref:DoxX family protein n=1 Tax=Nocardia sputi TaxID=2943705 RepID=UPI0027E31AA1|nr:DoxX family protein [Nocardia sputi]